MTTPIKFGTDGWRAVIAREFTFENLARVTAATADWLFTLSPTPSALVGYDCRFLGAEFAAQVATQLAEAGVQVQLTPGFVSTPMVSLATLQRQCTAGIILTASHNPPEYNGFKLKGSFGGPAFPAMIAAVEAAIPPTVPPVPDRFEHHLAQGTIAYYDAEALYLNHLKQTFDLPAMRAAPLKLAYDAMYGAGQRVFGRLFPAATVLHAEPNPGFGGQAPEPIEKNLGALQALLRAGGYHYGLATDGDADRIGLFDAEGNFIDSHHILLLLIHHLHAHKGLTGKVVCTFSCTQKISALCAHYNLPLEVTKIGFKYIGEIMAREAVLVGGEESGGIAVTGHAPERDGIYIGLMVLEMIAQRGLSLQALIEEIYGLVGRFSVQRIDLHLPQAQKERIVAACTAGQYAAFGPYRVAQTETLDGFKYHFEGGDWVLIRPSGTEPVLRIYAESATRHSAEAILAAVEATVMT
ncbi:MAG: phosphoglucomutase/phosphomannomutase family protein [Bacteroidia bacterium]|nr:phosphoglucomutase/phosphomannomutase family protein [Bacteroidia bacterium]